MPVRLINLIFILQVLISGTSNAQNVYIQGRWENGPKSVLLSYYEDATTAKSGILRSTIDSISHSFEFEFELKYATIVQLANESFIVKPGDTVRIDVLEVDGDQTLNFEGPKRSEHGFLTELREKVGQFRVDRYLVEENSLEKYETAIKNHFDSCLTFLNRYSLMNNVTEPFQKIARDFLTIQYYEDLIYLVNSKNISKDKLPPQYFDPVDFSFFNKTHLLGLREFILLVSNYNAFYFSSPLIKTYYDSANIAPRIQAALDNFEGEVRDHLLLFMFTNLLQNGVGQSKSQVQRLHEFLIDAFKKEPSRVIQIQELKRNFDLIGRPLPGEILAQRLKRIDGSEISFNEILTKDNVIYIDFWASWCGPCLSEMPNEKQLISEFKGKQIRFIFISIDKDSNEWLKAISKINVDGTHYLISEGVKSTLIKYLSFNEIPRYIIIDKRGLVVSRNAPRPGFVLKNKSVLLDIVN